MEIRQKEPLDRESQDWQDADLSKLDDYGPFDWGKDDPKTLGRRISYDIEQGFQIEDGV